MADGRSNRKAKVIPFIDRLERDRRANLKALVKKSKMMKLDGFESISWDDNTWLITAGRLVKLTGRNTSIASFNFSLSKKLGSEVLEGDWSDVAKALFILRFHRKHQTAPNQRSFITAIGYVSYSASKLMPACTPKSKPVSNFI